MIEREDIQHERKAKQAISAALNEIVPKDVDRLWEATVSSPGTDFGGHASPDGVDKVLMETLANCYTK